jgi:hypothetical protein
VGDLALRVLLVVMVVAIAGGIAFLSRRNTSYHPPVEIRGLGLPPGLVVFSSTDCQRCKKVLAAARLVEAPLREVTYELEPQLQESVGVVGVPLTLAIDKSGQLVAQLAGVVRVGTLRRAATRAGF